MPRNPTTGVYTRTPNGFNTPVYGAVIDPTDADNTFNSYDDAITNSPAAPVSSTDNAVARYDGATGRFLANTGVTIDDSNNVKTSGYLRVGSASDPTNTTAGDITGIRISVGNASLAGRLGIVSGALNANSGSGFGLRVEPTIQSDFTNIFIGVGSNPLTAAGSYSFNELRHFNANPGTFGAGSSVTSQFGFYAQSTLTGATNNYGFYSQIASGTGRWGFYGAGTAANYFAGNLQINTLTTDQAKLSIVGTNDGQRNIESTKNLTGTIAGVSAGENVANERLVTNYNSTTTDSQYSITGIGKSNRVYVGLTTPANGSVIADFSPVEIYDYNSSGIGGGTSEVAGSFMTLNSNYTYTNHDANYWLADWNLQGPTSGQEKFAGAVLSAQKYNATETIDSTHSGFYGWTIQSKPGSGAGGTSHQPVTSNLTTSSGSPTATVASATGLVVGMYVDGANVLANTTISNIVGTTITLSQNASGTGTASTVFRLITYRGRAAYSVSGWAGPVGLPTDGSSSSATSAWEYGFAAGLTGNIWIGNTARSKYTTAFYAKDYLGYGLEIDTRHGDNTGQAIYTHSDAGNVGLGTAPDTNYRLAVGGSATLAGGTVTASQPLNFTQTWNNAAVVFTGIKSNVTDTASDGASLLIDLQVGGASKFFVFKSGSTVIDPAASFLFSGRGGTMASSDGVLKLRNNANSDFGRLQFGGTTSSFPSLKRSGTTIAVRLADDSADAPLTASYVKTASTTVASLPAAATAGAGARSFVTDATATTFSSTVAGGGSNKVPVFSDGTNWLVG